MRANRNSLQKIRRLLKLLECLQSGQAHNAQDLAQLCGVTRRQIFRDLRALQDSGIRVLFDASRQSYCVTNPTFLPAAELSLTEALAVLVLAGSLGDPAHGIPLLETARDAAVKISSSLPHHLRQYLGELTDAIHVRPAPASRLGHARRTLEQIHRALAARERIRVRYNSLFEQKIIRTLVSPYRLLFARHSWYVIGRSSLHRAVRMFHLGRILECDLTGEHFDMPARFSLERHFGNAWAFIRERGAETRVRIRFQPLVSTNVSEVIWHKTQQLRWNGDGTLDFQATVSGLREISWWVLGYGDQAEVLEPPELRELIAERAKGMVKLYRRTKRSGRTTGR